RAGGGGEAGSHEKEDRQCREKAMQTLHSGVPFQLGESDRRAKVTSSTFRRRSTMADVLRCVTLIMRDVNPALNRCLHRGPGNATIRSITDCRISRALP